MPNTQRKFMFLTKLHPHSLTVSKAQLCKKETEDDNEWGLDAPASSAMMRKIQGSKGCCQLLVADTEPALPLTWPPSSEIRPYL